MKVHSGHKPETQKSSYEFSTWKKALCLIALCMILAGGAISLLGHSERAVESSQGKGTKAEAFLPEGFPAPPPEAVQEESPPWGPALLKAGAGFLIGFSIGYALRAVFKMAVFVLGFALLGLAALQYAGWINVQWSVVQDQLSSLGTTLRDQFHSFTQFLSGVIPAAGFAGLGLFTGLKRK